MLLRQPQADATPSLRALISHIVYSAETDDIRHVMVDGDWQIRDGACTSYDSAQLAAQTRQQLPMLLSRAGLSR